MSWKSQMGPASFRGVKFHVENAEFGGGRRTVEHEYPLRDDPFVEDLGRKARSFPVEGYVVGDEYIAARDALITELEKSGPGELVHPYFGTRRVAVVSFRVRESVDRGGMSQISIEFVETPAQPVNPAATVNAPAKLAASASVAKLSVGEEFLAKYNPGPLLDSAADGLRSATLAVSNVLGKVTTAEQKLARITHEAARLRSVAGSIVSVPADVLSTIQDLIEEFDDGLSSAVLLAIYGFDMGVRPVGTTPNRVQEQTNFDAMQMLVQRLVVIQAASLAPEFPFESFEQATAYRSKLTDMLDEQAEIVSDDTFPALLQVRADLTNAVPGEAGDLPRLLKYTPPVTLPSLVLAHQLYGDVSKEQDLIARNRIRNPVYVVGGNELEVLSNG